MSPYEAREGGQARPTAETPGAQRVSTAAEDQGLPREAPTRWLEPDDGIFLKTYHIYNIGIILMIWLLYIIIVWLWYDYIIRYDYFMIIIYIYEYDWKYLVQIFYHQFIGEWSRSCGKPYLIAGYIQHVWNLRKPGWNSIDVPSWKHFRSLISELFGVSIVGVVFSDQYLPIATPKIDMYITRDDMLELVVTPH